jgi:hypothetical protein
MPGCETVAIAGYGGGVTIGGTHTEFREWTIDVTTDLYEASYLGKQWKQFVEGLKGATGSFVCRGAFSLPTSVAGAVFDTGNATLTFDLKISSVSPHTPVDGLVEHTVNFTACGTVTLGS